MTIILIPVFLFKKSKFQSRSFTGGNNNTSKCDGQNSCGDSDYYLGRSHFVTLVIEHENAPNYPRMTRDRLADFTVDKNRLILSSVPIELFEEESTVLAAQDEFYHLPVEFPTDESKPLLTVEADDRGMKRVRLILEEDYSLPEFQISSENDKIIVSLEGERFQIEPNEENEIRLNETSVKVSERDGSTKTADLVPILKINNYGRLHVFGAIGARLLPLNSNDGYAKNRVAALSASSESEVKIDEEHDLVITEGNPMEK